MNFQIRTAAASRPARTALRLALLVGVAAGWVPAVAFAQLPPVTVYHSIDPVGADPRGAAPPGCTPGTEGSGLSNAGFESGALSPWFQDSVVSGGEDWNVWSEDAHSGAFSATNTGNKEIRQNLVDPVPTDSITEMSFWLRHPDPGGGQAAFVTLFYEEGSTGFIVNTSGTDWQFFDVTESLQPGQMLVAFSVYGNSVGDPEFTRTELDDVTLSPGGSTPASCVIHGTANEALELWIDGGPNAGGAGETLCKMGAGGGSGDQLCGADILFQLTGVGELTRFDPDAALDTLVCSPCSWDDELGLYLLPPNTQQLRVNFRRGALPPALGPRRLGTLVVDSTGLVAPTETTVTAFGEAAGAALQLRGLASAAEPELVATSNPIPEPGWLLQLATGVMGLAALRRLRS